MGMVPLFRGPVHVDVTFGSRPAMLAGAQHKSRPAPPSFSGKRVRTSKDSVMILSDRGRGVDTPVSTVSCPVASFLGRQARRRGRRGTCPSSQRGES